MDRTPKAFYSSWAGLYDLMIDWPKRLSGEIPLLEKWLRQGEARKVLDTACGSGRHAMALAERGFELTGTDLNEGFLRLARKGARDLPRDRRPLFLKWDFSIAAPARLESRSPFDAILCLGNSFPHLIDAASVRVALEQFRSRLAPGGRVLIQMKNLVRRQKRGETQLPLIRRTLPDGQAVHFIRFYDFISPGTDVAEFHLVVTAPRLLHRVALLKVWTEEDFNRTAREAGFMKVGFHADLACTKAFDPEASEDRVCNLESRI
jgi:SAM-dependent methyltransferase